MAERVTILQVNLDKSGVRQYDERDKKNVLAFVKAVQIRTIQDYKSKKLRSSGKFERETAVGINQHAAYFTGPAYVQQMILGRRPGKFPPVAEILRWIKEKGIQPKDIKQEGLAYIIARKIAKEGTDIYKGKKAGLDVVGAVKDSLEELKTYTRESITGRINSKLKFFNPNAK